MPIAGPQRQSVIAAKNGTFQISFRFTAAPGGLPDRASSSVSMRHDGMNTSPRMTSLLPVPIRPITSQLSSTA